MKTIILKVNRFEGGACLSLLEYGKIFRSEGHAVLAVGAGGRNERNYIEQDIEVLKLNEFDWWSPLKNLVALIRYIKIIHREKPDLIVAIAFNNCIFHRIIQRIVDVPVVCIVPGGEVPRYFATALKDIDLIVFSEENCDELVRRGYARGKIEVITNRLAVPSCTAEPQSTPLPETVELLLVCRLERVKRIGILSTIGCFERLLQSSGRLHLSIVGDGELRADVQAEADRINQAYGKEVISLVGYVSDVVPYIAKSHIVFGKGRSVLDAVLRNKPSFVTAETGALYCCRPERIQELALTNFTGRRIGAASDDELLVSTLRDMIDSGVVPSWGAESGEIARSIYSIDLARHRILNYMDNRMRNNKPSPRIVSWKLLMGALECLRLYFVRVADALGGHSSKL